MATLAARLLQGKHKATYTPFLDGGDHVVIVNAATVKLTPDPLLAKALPGKLARDVGDKDEVHTSEEELGVTTPRKAKEGA